MSSAHVEEAPTSQRRSSRRIKAIAETNYQPHSKNFSESVNQQVKRASSRQASGRTSKSIKLAPDTALVADKLSKRRADASKTTKLAKESKKPNATDKSAATKAAVKSTVTKPTKKSITAKTANKSVASKTTNVKAAAKSKSTTSGKKGNQPTTSKSTKKQAASTSTKKSAVLAKKSGKCVKDCNPGPNNDCWQRSGIKRTGMLSCTEVYAMLKSLGVKKFTNLSKCMLSGLMRGVLKVPEGGNLDTVLFEWPGDYCDHQVKVTLRKLLYQPDFGGNDYEEDRESATVVCEAHELEPNDCPDGRYYVTNLCTPDPTLDCGKFHNHCDGCPGFGRCLGDYREFCYIETKTGIHGPTGFGNPWSRNTNQVVIKMADS